MAFSADLESRHFALIGLMGAGKTSVGRLLALRLGLPFHDSDETVAHAAGLSIGELFARQGEPAFRALERAALARLLAGERSVIATGGGAVTEPATREALRGQAFTIWLDAAPATLAVRLAESSERPVIDGGDAKLILDRLSEQRRPFYAAADLRVGTDDLMAEEVAELIIATLR
ncbi:MAG: shikimate kinase [Alphaproteobacteria bacterium]|jgi:shikimate kinase|nr:shikimate kinase [Alphaproteobacteria bacterium]